MVTTPQLYDKKELENKAFRLYTEGKSVEQIEAEIGFPIYLCISALENRVTSIIIKTW